MNLKMVKHNSLVDQFDWPAGHFAWGEVQSDGSRYIHMMLPSPDPSLCILPLTTDPADKHPGNWLWDGNLDKPTITPSINHDPRNPGSAAHWHGFCTNGEMVTV